MGRNPGFQGGSHASSSSCRGVSRTTASGRYLAGCSPASFRRRRLPAGRLPCARHRREAVRREAGIWGLPPGLARRRLGLARSRCGNWTWPRARQRSGLGSRLGMGARLGCSRLRFVGRLHEMASSLDWLGMAGCPRERLLVRRNDLHQILTPCRPSPGRSRLKLRPPMHGGLFIYPDLLPASTTSIGVIQAAEPEPRIMRYELTDFEWTAIMSPRPSERDLNSEIAFWLRRC